MRPPRGRVSSHSDRCGLQDTRTGLSERDRPQFKPSQNHAGDIGGSRLVPAAETCDDANPGARIPRNIER